MASARSLRRWGLVLLIGLTLAAAGGMGWVEHQLRTVQGAYTEVVDVAPFPSAASPVAIVDVAVLAPDGLSMVEGQTVVLRDGVIAAVGPDIPVPDGYPVVDGAGRYLIPGLVDGHVHTGANPNDFLLYLANGVTSIREMSGGDAHLRWREQQRNGRLAPRMVVASRKISGKGGVAGWFERWTRNRLNYPDSTAARSVIRTLRAEGYDALKMSGQLPDDVYRATVAIARAEGIAVVGHVPDEVAIGAFPSLGQQEVAHVEELTKSLIRSFGGMSHENADAFLQYVRDEAPGLAQDLADHGVAVTSTIWLVENLPGQTFALEDALKSVALSYANPAFVEGTRLTPGWLPGSHANSLSEETRRSPAAMRELRVFWETYVEAVHIVLPELVEAGVVVLAGTDANAPLLVPGFSLHDELASLARAGMTPAQALRSATAAPGAWQGTQTGAIRPGYRADVLLLTADPLDDIAHTRSIAEVYLGGRRLDRATLDAMLRAVAEANERSRRISIEPYRSARDR